MSATAEQRNDQVRAILQAASKALGPTEIARRIDAEWCSLPYRGRRSPQSAPVVPVLRRIGALTLKGKYWMPKVAA